MNIRSAFFNDEPRLRAGWRLLLQTLLLVLFSIGIGLPIGILFLINPELEGNLLINQLVAVIVITGSVFIARRWFDRCSITSLGLKVNLRVIVDLVVGMLIPFLMMGLIYLILWLMGWLTFEKYAWQEESFSTVFIETLFVLIFFILVGWSEELLSRGYHLQSLESGLNTFWAVLISSSVFGILHLGNPNTESAFLVASGIFLAGVFLAFGYLRTRQLWLPIGLHFGWNFFGGAFFGFPISGLDIFSLMRIKVDGPELWTGGAFGPEAGLVLIPGMALGFILVTVYTRSDLYRQLSKESSEVEHLA